MFDTEFGSLYCPDNGSPGKPMRAYLGRVVRDIARKTADRPAQQAVSAGELALARRLSDQKKEDKNRLYSMHAPVTTCA